MFRCRDANETLFRARRGASRVKAYRAHLDDPRGADLLAVDLWSLGLGR